MLVGLGEFAKLLGVGLYFVHEDAASEPSLAESIEHNAELCLEPLDLIHLAGDANVKRNAKGANAHVADMGLLGDCGAARCEQTIKSVLQHRAVYGDACACKAKALSHAFRLDEHGRLTEAALADDDGGA